MLSSQHHVTLEEISRLEAERDRINLLIKNLRASLPREKIEVMAPSVNREGRTVSTRQNISISEAPVTSLRAPALVTKEAEITDHAVIRYLERQYGFEFDAMKLALLTDTVKLAVRMGAESVKTHGGRLMIRGNRIVSFIGGPMMKQRRKR